MADEMRPIILDLGKRKAKQLKSLKRGEGALLDEVGQAISSMRDELSSELAGKEIVPVIVLYEKKQKRRMRLPFMY